MSNGFSVTGLLDKATTLRFSFSHLLSSQISRFLSAGAATRQHAKGDISGPLPAVPLVILLQTSGGLAMQSHG